MKLLFQLTPVERYAMRFIEQTEAAWSAEQLAAAEREIEEQKREWEHNRLIAMREEEERRAREMEEEADILTYSREDATNQVSSKSKKLSAKLNNSGGKKLKKVINVQSKNSKNKGGEADEKLKPKFKEKLRFSNRIRKNSVAKNEEIEAINDDDSQTSTVSIAESVKVNGDSNDSNSKWSLENSNSDSSDSDSLPLMPRNRVMSNHVDHNSPRTRSRGTVAINLWTLDVSPILPGVKPVKGCPGTSLIKRERSRNSSSEKEVDVEIKIKKRKGGADKQISAQKTENLEKRGGRFRNSEVVKNNKKIGKIKNLKSTIIDEKQLADSCEINLVCNATTDDDKTFEASVKQENDQQETNESLNNHDDSVNSTEGISENVEDSVENAVDKTQEAVDRTKENVDKTNENIEKVNEDSDKTKETINHTKAEAEEIVNFCKEKVCKVVVEDVVATGKIDKYMLKNNNDNLETNSVDAHNNSNSAEDEKSTNKSKKILNNTRKKKVNKNSVKVADTFLDGWVTKLPTPPDKSDCDKNNCDEINNPDS